VLTYRSSRNLFILTLVSLCALSHPSAAASKKKTEVKIKDGKNYRAEEAGRPMSGALLVFRKQGTETIGIGYNPYMGVCYHGSLDGSVIHVREAVFEHTDFQTKEVSYEPITSESDQNRFKDIKFYGLEPFPNPAAILPTPSNLVERDVRSLNECAKHFGAANEEAAPCNDPNLVATMKAGDTIKYTHTSIACRKEESGNCTIDNVFRVLLGTPSAIAPVKDIGTPQEVKECGILILRSFTKGALGNNKIKTKIDFKNHAITNLTMKGHVFYPGRVVRYLVEVDGRIDINTEGLGAEGKWKTFVNEEAATVPYISVWDSADNELRDALLRKLGIPITEQ
jgi:hypothetical protein